MNLRWFVSRTVRQATDLRKQVWIILNSQRDVLGEKAIAEVSSALEEFAGVLRQRTDDKTLNAAADKLEKAASQWLKPYPNPGARENFKEFLVSGVLVLTLFNFFVQPMKIPSGSAQPTLYGNVVTSLKNGAAHEVPSRWWARALDWFKGIDYHVWVAKDDGVLRIEPVTTMAGFIKLQRFRVGSDSYSIWFPPEHLERDAGAFQGQTFRKGETVLALKISSGDRLFVDRCTYNFRRPERGEVIVFSSADIDRHLRDYNGAPILIPNTHYIKRLVALDGEQVRLGNDRHLVINGQRLDASTPHFENVYSFAGPPRESVYSGHANDTVAAQCGKPGLAPMFRDPQTTFVVRPNHLLAFGDNTMNSYDGRAWGDFPREKVVGRACFVFWPLTGRFGLVNR
jgi:signal peptidase I